MNETQTLELVNENITTDAAAAELQTSTGWRSRKLFKTIAMYITMVCVSTVAICLLEHASVFNAFRTALVAAVGKTVAANWVSGIFD